MVAVMTTTSALSRKDRRDHLLARLGYRRMEHMVTPGLYLLGTPLPTSPVFVSANYTLSFDALRSSLAGMDAFILVLDTNGINVWCAAGKGTFGTEELIRKVEETNLRDHVSHRTLILPQLGAPGVSAHEVKKATGFTVEYGPVRAEDIPSYMRSGIAPGMRKVTFPLRDRVVLVPVEVRNTFLPMVLATVSLLLLGGVVPALIALTAVMVGAALFPLLLPLLPTKDFTSKGLVLGALASVPFAWYYLASGGPLWASLLNASGTILLVAAVVAYLGLNFTGCSTYASRTGVRREIFRYIPVLVAMVVLGLAAVTLTVTGTMMGWY